MKKVFIVIASIVLIVLIVFFVSVFNDMNSVYFEGKDFQYKRKYKEAIECFTKAIKEDGIFKSNAYLHRGEVYAKIKEYEKSLADFDSAFFASPQNYSALNYKSETYLLMGDFENALELINRSVNVKSTSDAHIVKGKIFWKMGELINAENEYEIAIQLDSSSSTPFFKRAYFYSHNNEHEKAITDLNIAIELSSDNAVYYNNRGWSNRALGNYDFALQDIHKAISIDSTHANFYHSLATVYFEINDREKEFSTLDKYLKFKEEYEINPLDSILERFEELKSN